MGDVAPPPPENGHFLSKDGHFLPKNGLKMPFLGQKQCFLGSGGPYNTLQPISQVPHKRKPCVAGLET